jgi:protein N-lysine methyltransferase METTL21D
MEASSTCSVDFPRGTITLPASATFVSDTDEEIFLLYTRLAALKPADSTDAGHFHGLGFENSKEDALVVRIELNPPSGSTHESSHRKLGNGGGTISRRNRGRKRKGTSVSGTGGAMIEEPELEPEPVVLEYELSQDKTALRSRSGDTGSVLWKTRSAWSFSLCSIILIIWL